VILQEEKIKKLHEIVKQAGSVLMEFYQTELNRFHKEDGSFATQADHASEKYLIEHLTQLLPGAGFYAEESGVTESLNDYMWVIDPLDGTSNFANGIAYFCVSVALLYKNTPVIGCIFNPSIQEFFYAQSGKGAYCNGVRISIGDKKDSMQSRIAVELAVSDFHLLKAVWYKVDSIRSCGASALDIAHCASGRYDGVILTQFMWWDIAAGIILLQEAGGGAVTFDEKIPDFSSKSFVAGNDFLINEYLKLIKDENSI
jgi:myo-inositol-1(or 4)-monophosphatase